MDKRKKYIMVLDTETANGIMVDNKLDLTQSLVYDIGYAIVDKKGEVYLKRSFVVYDIFVGYKDMMKSAYYAQKIPRYWADIKAGTRKLARFETIKKIVREDMAEWNCTTVAAHNAQFDDRATRNTTRYLSKSFYRYFFPYGTEIWDTLKMARDTICKQKAYIKFCNDNGFMTKHKTPRVRANAETLYRYLINDATFEESHTGLEDVLIEKEIMVKCFAQHKKMRKLLYEDSAS